MHPAEQGYSLQRKFWQLEKKEEEKDATASVAAAAAAVGLIGGAAHRMWWTQLYAAQEISPLQRGQRLWPRRPEDRKGPPGIASPGADGVSPIMMSYDASHSVQSGAWAHGARETALSWCRVAHSAHSRTGGLRDPGSSSAMDFAITATRWPRTARRQELMELFPSRWLGDLSVSLLESELYCSRPGYSGASVRLVGSYRTYRYRTYEYGTPVYRVHRYKFYYKY